MSQWTPSPLPILMSGEDQLDQQLLANEARWEQLQQLFASEIGAMAGARRSLFPDDDDDDALQDQVQEALQPIIAAAASSTTKRTATTLAGLQRDLDGAWYSDDLLRPDSDDFLDVLNNLRVLAGQLPTNIRL